MERTVYITLQIGARHERRWRELDGVCAIHSNFILYSNWPLVLFSLGYYYDLIFRLFNKYFLMRTMNGLLCAIVNEF